MPLCFPYGALRRLVHALLLIMAASAATAEAKDVHADHPEIGNEDEHV